MSDFQAIGGVSATLQTLLEDRMELPDGVVSVPVSIGPPVFSAKDVDPHKEEPRLNIFLYRVTENACLQNQEIPGRGASSGFGHPPLSLNLHYLIIGYGNVQTRAEGVPIFDDTNAHFVLGSAMRVLHDVPIVTDNLTTARPPSGLPILHTSLRNEFEHVKLTLEPLSLEDITKIWTALALRYRVSAAYVVNVVQIESQRPRRFPRPVGRPTSPITPPLPGDAPTPGPMVYVLPMQPPTITDLRVRRVGETTEQSFPYARILDTLVLRGTSLSGRVTTVGIGDLRVPASYVGADRVEAVIPDATIPGLGPIPPGSLLQPGVSTVQVIVSDPLVPHSAFTSNDAVFMLVPAIDAATVVYSAGPPRALTFDGTRLVSESPGGETIIGRSAVPRTLYASESPTHLQVPIPDTLPTRGVQTLLSGPLADVVAIGAGAQTLNITIGATTGTATANLPPTVQRASLAAILASLIHDALPTDARFAGTRVDLWGDRLLVVPGGLTDPVTIASPGGLTFASDLGLTAPQPPGGGTALVSGELPSPPPLSSPSPRVTLTIGIQPPVTVSVQQSTSLAALAALLQAAINAAIGTAEYANALVGISGSQLLVIPGAAGTVAFSAATGDDTTVVQLQLHANFGVRVRVNGAESIDAASVELPQ
jgi:hypothetical protein